MKEVINECLLIAPVMIPTLCRYEHLRNCIESLANNDLADQTDLYVSVDYPTKDSHWPGYNKILNYLDEGVSGFRNVYIYKQKNNLGAVGNSQYLYNVIKDKYACYIYSEDDNVFSPNFLRYINEGLTKYEADEKVYSICGYCYPVDSLKETNGYLLYPAFSAWGYGTWFEKEQAFLESRRNLDSSKKILNSFPKTRKLLNESTATLDNLISMTALGVTHGDTIIESKIVTEGYKCLFPTLSKVKNAGHDGSGLHCGNSNKELFDSQSIDESRKLELTIAEGLEFEKYYGALKGYKTYNRRGKNIVWAKYVLYKLHMYYFLKNSQIIRKFIPFFM